MAMEHFVRLRTIDGAAQQEREAQRWAAVLRVHPGARREFDRLTQEAVRYAGPYQVEINWQVRPTRAHPTGHLIVAVRGREGEELPNVELSITGHGALQVIEAPASTGADGAAHVRVALPPPDEHAVRGAISVRAHALPGARPRVFVPQPATVQRMLAAPAPVEIAAQATVELTPQIYRPTLTTRTRDVIATAGAPAVDVVTLRDGRPHAQFSGTSTLYGPFNSMSELTAAGPDTAPIVGEARFAGTYDAGGNAEVHTTELQFPNAGYYTWVESLDERRTVLPPAPPAWPQIPETSVVLAPEVSTLLTADASRAPTALPAALADELQITGIPASREVPGSTVPLSVTISGRIAGPSRPATPRMAPRVSQPNGPMHPPWPRTAGQSGWASA